MCLTVCLCICSLASSFRAWIISILSLPLPTIMPGSGNYWKDIYGTNKSTLWTYPIPYIPAGTAVPGSLELMTFKGTQESLFMTSLQAEFPSTTSLWLPLVCLKDSSTLPPTSLWSPLWPHIIGLSTFACILWLVHSSIIFWCLILSKAKFPQLGP